MRPGDPIQAIRGIGPRLSEALSREGVHRVQDLLLHLPLRYQDRTQCLTVREAVAAGDGPVLVFGRVHRIASRRGRRRSMAIVTAVVEDGTGRLPLVWFNNPWMERTLRRTTSAFLYGCLGAGPDGQRQLVNAEVEDDNAEGIVPVYGKVGPLSGRRLRRIIASALPSADGLEDPLPAATRQELGLPDLATAVRAVHDPRRPSGPGLAELLDRLNHRTTEHHRRLALDELLAVTCGMSARRLQRSRLRAPRCVAARDVDHMARRLVPFSLTAAQQRVTAEILRELEGPSPMGRLVQGDVGSGKTVVAALAMLAVAESGYQAVLMAPTELLAEQHARTLSGYLTGAGIEPLLITASLGASERRRAHEQLRSGQARVVVGTHALFQEVVVFRRLGFVVVDEQHRFGVRQRQALVGKGPAPHLLVMTATPIPRSLALTLYGDLRLSIIDELPPGRRPVRTVIRPFAATPRLLEFVRREIAAGGRLYMVFPLIEGSDSLPAQALEDAVDEVRAALPGIEVGVLHGRLDRSERDRITEGFRLGSVQALLATTVVEVGVDVPEATVMVISSADRFGLSQLHQLRGRVGRGQRRSWCVLLVDDAASADARRRLEVLCRCHDGFEIAEEDLRLRGPGEVCGTRQWGFARFRFADIVQHRDLIELARRLADELARQGRLAAVQKILRRYHPLVEPAIGDAG